MVYSSITLPVEASLEEITELLRTQTKMNLLSDLLFHDMITEEVYKSELENIATTEMHMSIKFLK